MVVLSVASCMLGEIVLVDLSFASFCCLRNRDGWNLAVCSCSSFCYWLLLVTSLFLLFGLLDFFYFVVVPFPF